MATPDSPFDLSADELLELSSEGAPRSPRLRLDPERQNAIKERAQAQQNARRVQPFATGMNPMMNHGASGAYYAALGTAQQGNALGNMISQTMNAIQNENDSRLAQVREMRRMEHEKELKRMELDAILARLAQAQRPTGPQPKAAFRGGAIY